MKTLYERFLWLNNKFIGLLMLLMCTLIVVQVFFRYVLFHSLPWSEELSRYFFVWLVFLGVNLGIRDRIEIRIDILDNLLRGKARKYLAVFQLLVSMVSVGFMFYSSIFLVEAGFVSTSVSMGIPMAFVYICIPVGMLFAMIELVRNVVITIKGDK